jgi:hypothetical protein
MLISTPEGPIDCDPQYVNWLSLSEVQASSILNIQFLPRSKHTDVLLRTPTGWTLSGEINPIFILRIIMHNVSKLFAQNKSLRQQQQQQQHLSHSMFVKGPIHCKLNWAVCVKNCTKNCAECPLPQNKFPIRFVSFFVSSVECLEVMPSWCRQVN